jgi:hypothetical protein
MLALFEYPTTSYSTLDFTQFGKSNQHVVQSQFAKKNSEAIRLRQCGQGRGQGNKRHQAACKFDRNQMKCKSSQQSILQK